MFIIIVESEVHVVVKTSLLFPFFNRLVEQQIWPQLDDPLAPMLFCKLRHVNKNLCKYVNNSIEWSTLMIAYPEAFGYHNYIDKHDLLQAFLTWD